MYITYPYFLLSSIFWKNRHHMVSFIKSDIAVPPTRRWVSKVSSAVSKKDCFIVQRKRICFRISSFWNSDNKISFYQVKKCFNIEWNTFSVIDVTFILSLRQSLKNLYLYKNKIDSTAVIFIYFTLKQSMYINI